MMSFDKNINRRNTQSVKWDLCPQDILPLWVADMDFESPKEVIDALQKRVLHGVFGYTYPQDSYYKAVIDWMKRRHNWEVEKDWIVITPGIVTALNIIVQTFTKEGESILIQRPVYNPFTYAIVNNNRKLINSPLINVNNHYEIDFKDFENKIINNNVKLFIMCSPHNPVGRVWTKEELEKMGDICLKHNVLVVVDEIHHDIVFKNYKHIPFAALKSEFADNCITCTAPSKTFNLAGLKNSNIIIKNQKIRDKIKSFLKNISLTSSNIFGMIACEESYKNGEKWLEQLIDYLEDNKRFVENFIKENIPKVTVINSEATYLLWLDFRKLGMNNKELEDLMFKQAKLWLNQGYIYGEEGSGYVRLNIACTKFLLEKALLRLKDALIKVL